MSQPTLQLLMETLTKKTFSHEEVHQQLEFMRTSAAKGEIKDALETLSPFVESIQDDLLKEWLQLAFLGTCVGFIERDLNPSHPAHQYIYPKLVKDIAQMHQRIEEEQIHYDADLLKFQVYDYGIQTVYYLDWTLYMSQELY